MLMRSGLVGRWRISDGDVIIHCKHVTEGSQTDGVICWSMQTSERVDIIICLYQVPSEHETITQCCFNVGPTSKTAGLH